MMKKTEARWSHLVLCTCLAALAGCPVKEPKPTLERVMQATRITVDPREKQKKRIDYMQPDKILRYQIGCMEPGILNIRPMSHPHLTFHLSHSHTPAPGELQPLQRDESRKVAEHTLFNLYVVSSPEAQVDTLVEFYVSCESSCERIRRHVSQGKLKNAEAEQQFAANNALGAVVAQQQAVASINTAISYSSSGCSDVVIPGVCGWLRQAAGWLLPSLNKQLKESLKGRRDTSWKDYLNRIDILLGKLKRGRCLAELQTTKADLSRGIYLALQSHWQKKAPDGARLDQARSITSLLDDTLTRYRKNPDFDDLYREAKARLDHELQKTKRCDDGIKEARETASKGRQAAANKRNREAARALTRLRAKISRAKALCPAGKVAPHLEYLNATTSLFNVVVHAKKISEISTKSAQECLKRLGRMPSSIAGPSEGELRKIVLSYSSARQAKLARCCAGAKKDISGWFNTSDCSAIMSIKPTVQAHCHKVFKETGRYFTQCRSCIPMGTLRFEGSSQKESRSYDETRTRNCMSVGIRPEGRPFDLVLYVTPGFTPSAKKGSFRFDPLPSSRAGLASWRYRHLNPERRLKMHLEISFERQKRINKPAFVAEAKIFERPN